MKKIILSIDPGKTKVAYARWDRETGQLLSAGLVIRKTQVAEERVDQWRQMAKTFWVCIDPLGKLNFYDLVVEIPQVYTGPQDEDRNDLVDLAGVVGAISAHTLIESVEWSPLPRDWKGQIPKEVTQKRVNKRLSDAEKGLVKWPIKSLAHNVYDALHLGIVYLEREGLREIPVPDRYPG